MAKRRRELISHPTSYSSDSRQTNQHCIARHGSQLWWHQLVAFGGGLKAAALCTSRVSPHPLSLPEGRRTHPGPMEVLDSDEAGVRQLHGHHLNVTQRALSATQRALSVTQRALSVTQQALSVTQRALNVTQRALSVPQRPPASSQRSPPGGSPHRCWYGGWWRGAGSARVAAGVGGAAEEEELPAPASASAGSSVSIASPPAGVSATAWAPHSRTAGEICVLEADGDGAGRCCSSALS
jgi:hypothetical protein